MGTAELVKGLEQLQHDQVRGKLTAEDYPGNKMKRPALWQCWRDISSDSKDIAVDMHGSRGSKEEGSGVVKIPTPE